MHAGLLGIVRGINGEPTDPWYLMGAASLAALLLPFIATPLAWVVVEVLRKQADNASSNLSLPTELPATEEQVVRKHKHSNTSSAPEEDSSSGAVTSEHDIAEVDSLAKRRPSAVLKARNAKFLDAEVYDIQLLRMDLSKFQSLNKATCAMVYITLSCFSLSILCRKFSCMLYSICILF